MITVLARIEIFEGKEIDAVAEFKKMVEGVHQNEPGCLIYAVSRGNANTREFYVFEVYRDRESYDAHRKTDHMRTFQRAMDDYMDNSSFNVESLRQIAGFTRDPIEHIDG
ncbi:MAG TPA: putative quinol monooxygenase [Dehalococcoidia bacterium]|nr:putative quinol monooxygenase [Dehalococcoidia bacterium]